MCLALKSGCWDSNSCWILTCILLIILGVKISLVKIVRCKLVILVEILKILLRI